MKKRILSLILTITILMSMLTIAPLSANAATSGIYTYTISNGNATITACYYSASGDIVIPNTLGGYPVTSIGDYAFRSCRSLTSIIIPDSVTSIGDEAFYWCTSLTSIAIPDSVTSIGDEAFYDCESLTSITIPDSVTSIGEGAFFDCTSLTSITIPDSVTSIGDRAFSQCSSLTSITIPDSVTSIGEYAFSDCDSLTSITIDEGVTSIGDYAFSDCDSLTSITIPDSVTSIGEYAFSNCSALNDVYYIGSKDEWYNILIESGNNSLRRATIHYVSTEITSLTATVTDETTEVTVSIVYAPSNAIVYISAYDIEGNLLEIHKPLLTDGIAKATFEAENVYRYKAYVWGNNIKALSRAKELYLDAEPLT